MSPKEDELGQRFIRITQHSQIPSKPQDIFNIHKAMKLQVLLNKDQHSSSGHIP